MNFAVLCGVLVAPVRFAPAQLQEDLRSAREALAEGHQGAFRYTSKSDFARGFHHAARPLNRPPTPPSSSSAFSVRPPAW